MTCCRTVWLADLRVRVAGRGARFSVTTSDATCSGLGTARSNAGVGVLRGGVRRGRSQWAAFVACVKESLNKLSIRRKARQSGHVHYAAWLMYHHG